MIPVRTRLITVRDVANAMIADKTRKAKFVYQKRRSTDLSVYATCAIGGAAIVLDVEPNDLASRLSRAIRDGMPLPPLSDAQAYTLCGVIIEWNDDTSKKKAEIGQLILDTYDEEMLDMAV